MSRVWDILALLFLGLVLLACMGLVAGIGLAFGWLAYYGWLFGDSPAFNGVCAGLSALCAAGLVTMITLSGMGVREWLVTES
jgi:hypothetical protein